MTSTLEIIITSSVVSSLISGVAGPLLLQTNERRTSRAKVRESLAEVELLRWHDTSIEEFRKAIARLEANALVANTNRDLTNFYVLLSKICKQNSDTDAENSPYDYMGMIPSELNDLTKDCAEFLSDSLWKPFTTRFSRNSRLKKIKLRTLKIKNELKETERDIVWDVY